MSSFGIGKKHKIEGMLFQQIEAAITWPLRQEVMWPDQPMSYVRLPHDEEGIHFGGFIDHQLITVCSLFINGNEAQFRKLAVKQAFQGKGLGTRMLHHVFRYAQQQGVRRIWCNARYTKRHFYDRFNMRETNKTFQKGGIDYVIMECYFDNP